MKQQGLTVRFAFPMTIIPAWRSCTISAIPIHISAYNLDNSLYRPWKHFEKILHQQEILIRLLCPCLIPTRSGCCPVLIRKSPVKEESGRRLTLMMIGMPWRGLLVMPFLLSLSSTAAMAVALAKDGAEMMARKLRPVVLWVCI